MSRDVMIVDDSATIRRMVKKTIQMIGLGVGEIFEASNGIEALAQLADHEVSVIIVDINMPTMNGVQFLSRMKGNARLKEVPIVIASTEGSQKRIAQLVEMGAVGYVRKPFQPEQLRDVLTPLLGANEDENTEAAVGDIGDDIF